MVSWGIVYTKAAAADVPKLKAARLAEKAQTLIKILGENPFQKPPSYEAVCKVHIRGG